MATGPVTKIADVVVPEVFTPYVQQITEEKSRLIQSGAIVRNALLDQELSGGGITFNAPSFKDLDNDADNVSTDDETSSASPKKTGTATEIAVRLSRNQAWSSMDLAAALAGADPMQSIASRVGAYWTRRLQAVFLATMAGLFADNDAAPAGSDTHTQADMTVDIKGGGFVDGVTNFSSEAFIDAAVTMGDSMEDLGLFMCHSIVFSRMQKNNLIDFIPDARGEVDIPFFLGRMVVVDDGMPAAAGVYDSYLFGAGALQMGVSTPKVATEFDREPLQGDGGGRDILVNRVEWALHPVGNAYIGTSPNGGPANGAGANNLPDAGSWSRVWPERKQVKIARLVTRES